MEESVQQSHIHWKRWALVAIVVIGVLIIFGGPTRTNSLVSDGLFNVSIVAAFLGGVLSLLSPCSAAMLPAFFAYAFKEKTQLVKMTFVFWLGLATLFIPLGFSASLVSQLFVTHSAALFYVAGAIFILLGIFSFMDKTLTFGIHAPTYNAKRPVGTVYMMGLLFAFASGTCAAPIIGGIFTLAATQGQSAHAIVLLIIYSLGLIVPMLFVAWFFDKVDFANSGLIRGKEFAIGTKKIHSTKLITGIIFVLIGILFITTKGTNALLQHFGGAGLTDLYVSLNQSILLKTKDVQSGAVLAIVALIVIIVYGVRKFKDRNP